MSQTVSSEEIGLASERLEIVYGMLERWIEEGVVPGAAISIARGGRFLEPRGFGRMGPESAAAPLSPEAIFLVASVTKPVTATATMLLVERGKLRLDQPVMSVVPEFRTKHKDKITVRHLLTHTSGLPDMLPENEQLREQHAGLEVFIRHIYDCELAFEPGTNVQYQSCGIAMLGEIVERIEGMPLREFMRREIFEPLGMVDTSLGARSGMAPRIARVNIPEFQRGTNWHWNTEYWWSFGAPWGGMFSTVRDITVFCQMFLNGGTYGGAQILSPATVRTMITNQLLAMPKLSPDAKLRHAWGLGWSLGPQSGDLMSSRTFGHGGATGTVVWADPEWDLICALFTTQPGAPRSEVSNAVLGALA